MIDWLAEASKAANRIFDQAFEAHRGATPWRVQGYAVIFGNDGYETDDPRKRAQQEVAYVRRRLADAGIPEIAFGTSDEDHYTWAMIVRTDDIAWLEDVIWAGWNVANGDEPETIDGYRVYQTKERLASCVDELFGPQDSLN
jgi:hypothetical protein